MGGNNYEEVDLSQTGGRIVGTYSGRLTKIDFNDGTTLEGKIITKRKYSGEQWQEKVFLNGREINLSKVRELRVYMGVEEDETGIGASSLDAFLSEVGIGV